MKLEYLMLLLMFVALLLSMFDDKFGRKYMHVSTPKLDNLPNNLRQSMTLDNFDIEAWRRYQNTK